VWPDTNTRHYNVVDRRRNNSYEYAAKLVPGNNITVQVIRDFVAPNRQQEETCATSNIAAGIPLSLKWPDLQCHSHYYESFQAEFFVALQLSNSCQDFN